MNFEKGPGLKIRLKDGTELTVALDRSPFVLGRGGSDLDLKDASVSRKHCEIGAQEGNWTVKDLGSSNGTFLNGEKIAQHDLKDGDALKVGQTEIVFHSGILFGGRHTGKLHEAAVWSVIELSVGAADRQQWLRDYIGIVSRRFAAERAFVVEYEEAGGVSRVIAGLRGDFEQEENGEKAPLSHTIVEQVVHEKRPIVTTDADVDPRFSDAQSVNKYEIRTVVCAPVRWRGEVKGALYLERKYSKEAYSEDDAKELQDSADLLGVALFAWRGHMMETRSEWERDRLARVFPQARTESIIAAGGINSVRRRLAQGCVIRLDIGRARQLMDPSKTEAWRAISQLIGQINGIIQSHGGSILGEGIGIFESGGTKEGEWAVEAIRAGIEAQKAVRAVQKRMMKEQQLGIAAGAGIAGGELVMGYFGAGERTEYWALGDAERVANILAYQANDGEIFIDQTVYSKVNLFVDTSRVAPVSIPGFEQQIQVYRVVSY